MSLSRDNLRKIAGWTYEKRPLRRGYNMRTLALDVGALAATGEGGLAGTGGLTGRALPEASSWIGEKPVGAEMKATFVGGKGFGLKLLWDGTHPTTKWNDPENEIVIAMGPLCGNTNYPGSGKRLVVSLSPLTGVPIDSNVGGYFGPFLKFSGFDALELAGKSPRDLIIFIDGDAGLVEAYESPEGLESDTHILAEKLTRAFAASEAEADLAAVAVVSAAAAGSNRREGEGSGRSSGTRASRPWSAATRTWAPTTTGRPTPRPSSGSASSCTGRSWASTKGSPRCGASEPLTSWRS